MASITRLGQRRSLGRDIEVPLRMDSLHPQRPAECIVFVYSLISVHSLSVGASLERWRPKWAPDCGPSKPNWSSWLLFEGNCVQLGSSCRMLARHLLLDAAGGSGFAACLFGAPSLPGRPISWRTNLRNRQSHRHRFGPCAS